MIIGSAASCATIRTNATSWLWSLKLLSHAEAWQDRADGGTRMHMTRHLAPNGQTGRVRRNASTARRAMLQSYITIRWSLLQSPPHQFVKSALATLFYGSHNNARWAFHEGVAAAVVLVGLHPLHVRRRGTWSTQ